MHTRTQARAHARAFAYNGGCEPLYMHVIPVDHGNEQILTFLPLLSPSIFPSFVYSFCLPACLPVCLADFPSVHPPVHNQMRAEAGPPTFAVWDDESPPAGGVSRWKVRLL